MGLQRVLVVVALLQTLVSGCILTFQSSLTPSCNRDFQAVVKATDDMGALLPTGTAVTFSLGGRDVSGTVNGAGLASVSLPVGTDATQSLVITSGSCSITINIECIPILGCELVSTPQLCGPSSAVSVELLPTDKLVNKFGVASLQVQVADRTCSGSSSAAGNTALSCNLDATSLPSPSTLTFATRGCSTTFGPCQLADSTTYTFVDSNSLHPTFPGSTIVDYTNFVMSFDVYFEADSTTLAAGVATTTCCSGCVDGGGGILVEIIRFNDALNGYGDPGMGTFHMTMWTLNTNEDPGSLGVGKSWQPFSKPMTPFTWSSWVIYSTPGQFRICRVDLDECDCESFAWTPATQKPNSKVTTIGLGVQDVSQETCNFLTGNIRDFRICSNAITGTETCQKSLDVPVCQNNCDTFNGGCDANALCCQVNPAVRPECKCNRGFYGDGLTCTDINECLSIEPCADSYACVNVLGSFGCFPQAPFSSHDHDGHVKLRWRELGDRPRLKGLNMRVTRTSNGLVVQDVKIKHPESADSVKIKQLVTGVQYEFRLVAVTQAGDTIEGQPLIHTVE